MEKLNRHKYIKIFIIIIYTVALYGYSCLVFLPKTSSDTGSKNFYQGKGFIAEAENSIDVMMFGNSNVYCGFNPLIMQQKYNISAYSCGTDMQTVSNQYGLIEKAFANQNPKVVLLEANCFFENENNPWPAFFCKFQFLTVPFEYHSRWKSLKLRDFYTLPDRNSKDVNRGFYSSDLVKNNINKDYLGSAEQKPKHLKKITHNNLMSTIDLCKKNGVIVIIVSIPSPASWSYAKHYGVESFAKKNGLVYLDMNLLQDQIGIDWSTDSRDGDHLNKSGADKVSAYLADYVNDILKNQK